MKQSPLSNQLQVWADGGQPKTLHDLAVHFSRDAIAIVILLLMALPALPLPTGGVSHVFEIITMLLALELMIGRTTIWLPRRWRDKSLERFAHGKFFRQLVAVVRWFERFSRPRLAVAMNNRVFTLATGVFILVFAVAAFLAPPFSGLDTLPAMGVVVLALALIFSDALLALIGILLGVMGIGLVIAIGTTIYHLF